jgi:hypothetical protein
MDVHMAHPTERASEGSTPLPPNATQYGNDQSTVISGERQPEHFVPPPPPPESLTPAVPPVPEQPSPYYTQYAPPAQGGQQLAAGSTPASAAVPGQVPTYAKPQKESSRSVLGQIGCGVLLVILLIVGLCGGAGYLGYRWIASQANSTTSTNTGSTASNGGNGSNGTPTGQVTTMQINQTITYASDTIAIVSVQQASSFSDDNSSSNGIVRINVQEKNSNSNGGSFYYGDVLRLILPDKSTVAPDNTKEFTGPQVQTTQNNWWDFPAATNLPLDQMSLQFGTTNEAQMVVPLTGHADLSQYQPKTANPNAKTQYDGLTWTITSATVSFNAVGKQATNGMRYLTVNMSVDNNSSNDFNAYWGDYIRLKTGSSISAPTGDTNFPLNFATGSTGTKGILYFLVPQGSTSFTLVLLGNANTNPPISQAQINFQV